MYELITQSEYERLHKKALKKISSRASREIDALLNAYKEKKIVYNIIKDEYFFGTSYNFRVEMFTTYLTISECEDEWFIVKGIGGQFYKCDQESGIILLLNDIIDN
jgi:hypothetical protein